MKTAVINNVAPAGLKQIQTNRFNQIFLNNEWQVVNIPLDRPANPAHGLNRLMYRPNNKISLIVSYPDKRNIYMTRIFRDRKRGLGIGLQAFYYQVALSYLMKREAGGQGEFSVGRIFGAATPPPDPPCKNLAKTSQPAT